MRMITVSRIDQLNKGDIIILKHKIPISAILKESDNTLRKYKVLAIYPDYALCESMNGYPHTECFSLTQMREKKARIYR